MSRSSRPTALRLTVDKRGALDAMLAIVGSSDPALAARVLKAADYDVELATNRFLDAQTWRASSGSSRHLFLPTKQERDPERMEQEDKSTPCPSPLTPETPQKSLSRTQTRVATEFSPWTVRGDPSARWSKKLLGAVELKATLNTGTPGLLEIGTPVVFPRTPVSSSAASSGRSGARKHQSSNAFRILRFRRIDGVGGEFGSLSSGLSRALTPLLDRDLIALEGICVEVPPVIQMFSSVVLSVRIFLSAEFFGVDDNALLEEESKLSSSSSGSRLFNNSMASAWKNQQSGFNAVRCLVEFFRLVGIQPLQVGGVQDDDELEETLESTSTAPAAEGLRPTSSPDNPAEPKGSPEAETMSGSEPMDAIDETEPSPEMVDDDDDDMPPLEEVRGMSGDSSFTPPSVLLEPQSQHQVDAVSSDVPVDLAGFDFDVADLPAETLDLLAPSEPSKSSPPPPPPPRLSISRKKQRSSEDSVLKRMLSAFDKSHQEPTPGTTTEASGASEDSDDENRASLRMSEDQLNNLYGSGLVEHNELEPLEPNRPDVFLSKLHPYQMQALRWMVDRENQKGDLESLVQHPLWDRYCFSDGSNFWLNPFSLKVSLKFPQAARSCRGGILADEMGMGKTVETLALVVHNHPILSQFAPEDASLKYYESDDSEDGIPDHPPPPSPPQTPPSTLLRNRKRKSVSGPESSGRAAVRKSPRLLRKAALAAASRMSTAASEGVEISSSEGEEEEAERENDGSDSEDHSPLPQSPVVIAPDSAIADPSAVVSIGQRLLISGPNQPRKTTLVVCPTSLLNQWMDEIATHCPKLRAFLYYGEDRRDPDLLRYDIVVTSYGTLTAEAKRVPTKGQKNLVQQMEFLNRKSLLLKTHWFRIILDEAHYIKNRLTETAKACFRLKADRRWCLTGTPIQNRIDDVYSLVSFLREDPWANFGWWSKMISKPFEEKDPRALTRLRAVMRPLVLRRVKSMMIDGRPILELPECKRYEWTLEFSELERDFYNSLYQRSQTEFKGFVDKGLVLTKYSIILSLLLRLRQACDHPFLVFGRQNRTDQEYAKDIRGFIRRFVSKVSVREQEDQPGASAAYIDTLEGRLRDKDADCRICLDVLEQPVISECGHVFCRECINPVFNARGLARCPICRHVVSQNALMNVPSAAPLVELDFEKEWQHSAKTKHLLHWLRQLRAWERQRRKLVAANKKRRQAEEGDTEEDEKPQSPGSLSEPKSVDPTTEEGKRPNRDSDAESEFDPFPEDEYMNEDAPIKCVVFSQWTLMLDLIEIPLRAEEFSFARLDGSLSQPQRVEVLQRFSRDPELAILLVSLKAGGVGLNLVSANHVFFLDCWWNPAVEEQAVQRIHRIGQKRRVHVHRFFIRDSIEERILVLQKRKSNLAASVGMSSDEKKEMRVQDLRALFAV